MYTAFYTPAIGDLGYIRKWLKWKWGMWNIMINQQKFQGFNTFLYFFRSVQLNRYIMSVLLEFIVTIT